MPQVAGEVASVSFWFNAVHYELLGRQFGSRCCAAPVGDILLHCKVQGMRPAQHRGPHFYLNINSSPLRAAHIGHTAPVGKCCSRPVVRILQLNLAIQVAELSPPYAQQSTKGHPRTPP